MLQPLFSNAMETAAYVDALAVVEFVATFGTLCEIHMPIHLSDLLRSLQDPVKHPELGVLYHALLTCVLLDQVNPLEPLPLLPISPTPHALSQSPFLFSTGDFCSPPSLLPHLQPTSRILSGHWARIVEKNSLAWPMQHLHLRSLCKTCKHSPASSHADQ